MKALVNTLLAIAAPIALLLAPPGALAGPAEVRALVAQADKHAQKGEYEAGTALALKALAMARSARPADPEGVVLALNIACANQASQDLAKGLPYCVEDLALREKMWGPRDIRTAQSALFMAQINTVTGKLAEAAAAYPDIIKAYESAPKTRKLIAEAGDAACNYAVNLFALGRLAESEAQFRKGIALFGEAEDPAFANAWAECVTYFADRMMRQGRYVEAEPILKSALALREARAKDHPNTADTLGVYGDLLIRLGRYDEAEGMLRRAIAIAEAQASPPKATLGRALQNLGRLYMARGDMDLAMPLYQRAVDTFASMGDPARAILATLYRDMAAAEGGSGRLSEARAYSEKAYDLAKAAAVSPNDPPEIRLVQARLDYLAGDAAAGEAKAGEGLKGLEGLYGDKSPRAAAARVMVAQGAALRGDHAAARDLYARAANDIEAGGNRDRSLVSARIGEAREILATGGDAQAAWTASRTGSSLLTEKIIADSRSPGRSLDLTVSQDDRAAFQVALDAGWAYREKLRDK